MKYACIDRCRARYSVRLMCRLLDVSRSGYYAAKTRPESARSKQDRVLLQKIKRVHAQSKGVYGSPKIVAELADEGYRVGRNKVAKLMRLEGLRGCPRRRYRVTTQQDPRHRVAGNVLEQNFSTNKPNERWVADTTYIPTNQGWLYLAVVIDLYSRKVVGWSMSRWHSRRLVIDALRMAIDARQPTADLVHHSDRGSQYTSDNFRDELAKHNIECSMSRTGNCWEREACPWGAMRSPRASSGYSNESGSTEPGTERATKRVLTSSIISRCSITENDAMVTLATSVQ